MRAVDAEMAVIGAMVRDNEIAKELIAIVDERDFTTHFCRKAFAACTGFASDYDELLLANVMGKQHAESIRAAVDSASKPTAALEHAKRVANAAIIRRFIDACTEATVEATDFDSANAADLLELITRHQTAILDATARTARTSDFVHAKEGMRTLMKLIEDRRELYKNKSVKLPGFASGFTHLDHLIGGFQRKAMVVIGAQTGVGKSAMAINLAAGLLNDAARVVIMSHEMSTDDVYARHLAAESRVWASKMQVGSLESNDWAKLERAERSISEKPLWVTDNPPRTIPKLLHSCLQHRRRYGLDAVIVDYLQLMEATRPVNVREQAVAEIARGLKQLAMDLDVCVIALSQLNNNVERHVEPELSSLRESAAIAQNANSVILLWSKDDKVQEVNFKVAKNRSGPHGEGVLVFHKAFQRFQERLS